jgi:hypothetical protein
MKKRAQPETSPSENDFCERLAELEAELRSYPERAAQDPRAPMPAIKDVVAARIGHEAVVQFVHRGKTFAVGHIDVSFPGTNGARGVRRIHFYEGEHLVLEAAGEFENQQFGANLRACQLRKCVPGEWQAPFLEITTGLQTFRGDRKEELRKIRARAMKTRR